MRVQQEMSLNNSITIGREEEKGVVLNTVEAAVYSLQKPHRKQFIQILNIMETLT